MSSPARSSARTRSCVSAHCTFYWVRMIWRRMRPTLTKKKRRQGIRNKAANLRESLGKDGANTVSSKKRKKRMLKRVTKAEKRSMTISAKSSDQNGAFAAIHLLHDPHNLAEKLLSELRKAHNSEKFETEALNDLVGVAFDGLASSATPRFLPVCDAVFAAKHQREVTQVLAACVQAAHELVPPENVSTLLVHLVQHFVSDKSRPEVSATHTVPSLTATPQHSCIACTGALSDRCYLCVCACCNR